MAASVTWIGRTTRHCGVEVKFDFTISAQRQHRFLFEVGVGHALMPLRLHVLSLA